MSARLVNVVLYTRDMGALIAFYRALGVDLQPARQPGTFTADVAGCRVAVMPATEGEPPVQSGAPGSVLWGLEVPSVEEAIAAALPTGGSVLRHPASYDWGTRAVLADPDGRPVELVETSGRVG